MKVVHYAPAEKRNTLCGRRPGARGIWTDDPKKVEGCYECRRAVKRLFPWLDSWPSK